MSDDRDWSGVSTLLATEHWKRFGAVVQDVEVDYVGDVSRRGVNDRLCVLTHDAGVVPSLKCQ